MVKRLLTVVGGFGVLTIALAATAAAGGGGGLGGPGKFTFDDWAASASFSPPSGGEYSNVFVSVDRGMQTFRPRHGTGTPSEMNGTTLSVSQVLADGSFASGCWLLSDPSKFVIASDLSSASLAYATTVAEICPGILVPAAAGGRPGLQTVIGLGGGGPGGPPILISTISVDLAWTGSGALWRNTNNSTSHCGAFNSTSQGTFDFQFATATGSVGDLTGTSDPFSQVAHDTQTGNANGTATGACNPFGF